jgi:hypothetical protein
MKQTFCLFVSQTEAKIIQNGLRFASILHEFLTPYFLV